MRRRALTVVILAVVAAAFSGTWVVAYRMGQSDGRSKVAADRSAFLETRAAGSAQPATSGGRPGGAAPSVGAGGSIVTRAGTPGAGGTAGAGGSRGTTASGTGAPSGTLSRLAGRVTKIEGTTVSVQQTDGSTMTVTTTSDTAIWKLGSGALSDLKAGDAIAVAGAKTGDTAYSATTITSVGSLATVAAGASRPIVTGQIKSVNGDTIILQETGGVTVTVTASPATVVKREQPGTLRDITIGDLLVVQGEKSGATAFVARSIINQGASTG